MILYSLKYIIRFSCVVFFTVLYSNNIVWNGTDTRFAGTRLVRGYPFKFRVSRVPGYPPVYFAGTRVVSQYPLPSLVLTESLKNVCYNYLPLVLVTSFSKLILSVVILLISAL